jgi:hypothetical protein
MDQSQLLGTPAMSQVDRSLRFLGPNSGFNSRDGGQTLSTISTLKLGAGMASIRPAPWAPLVDLDADEKDWPLGMDSEGELNVEYPEDEECCTRPGKPAISQGPK